MTLRPCPVRLAAMVILLAGCKSAPAGDVSRDATVRDATARDADLRVDACIAGCHWDCFGGITCWGGGVFVLAYAPHPCCQFGDPWPYPGPICGYTDDNPHYECVLGCTGIEPRYAHCAHGRRAEEVQAADWSTDGTALASLLSMACEESQPKREGDPCVADEDCRPVAVDDAPRLTCDATSLSCSAVPRPDPPPGFGQDCGIIDWDGTGTYGYEIRSGVTCELCHVYAESGDPCLRQACTMPCAFDEDCPDGTVCVCIEPVYGFPFRICAATDQRDSPAGRADGLACAP